jgi:hypothetical protein
MWIQNRIRIRSRIGIKTKSRGIRIQIGIKRLQIHNTAALCVLSPCRSLKDDLLPHVTGGFRGRTIRVASIDYSPWMIFQRDSTGKNLASEQF